MFGFENALNLCKAHVCKEIFGYTDGIFVFILLKILLKILDFGMLHFVEN